MISSRTCSARPMSSYPIAHKCSDFVIVVPLFSRPAASAPVPYLAFSDPSSYIKPQGIRTLSMLLLLVEGRPCVAALFQGNHMGLPLHRTRRMCAPVILS